MPQKYSPDMNVPSAPMNTNGVYYKGLDWVNYTRDLDNIVKNNCGPEIVHKFFFWY